MMKKRNLMHVVFLLDRSGSMSGSESDTIGGFNSYIKKNKKKDYLVTTILFDDKYEKLYTAKHISDVAELTNKEYYVRGCTALLDALGKTINFMDHETKDKVLFVITTDGYENASHEFTKEKIKEMIKGHKNYEFMYIGADIDSYSEASNIGISRSNVANYRKSKKGINRMFDAVSMACEEYSCGSSIGSKWKESLDEYVSNNEE